MSSPLMILLLILVLFNQSHGLIPDRVMNSIKKALNPSAFDLREAEIKHGRIAMLAALGWPISELKHYDLARQIGMQDLLTTTSGKAPSILNGGLSNAPSLLALGVAFAVGSVLEYENIRRKSAPDSLQNFYDMWREEDFDEPGNFNFDPLNFKETLTKTPEQKVQMQKIEIFNGRVSMLATVGYVVQEIYTGLPVISETPEFFKPIWQ